MASGDQIDPEDGPHLIRVSGFERFGLHRHNPSGEVLPALQERYGSAIETVLLPVAWNEASELFLEDMKAGTITPTGIVMLGFASLRRGIHLEKRARNVAGSMRGLKLGGGRLTSSGVGAYETTAPIDMIHGRLQGSGIRSKVSDNAGTYICNQLYFDALHHVSGLDVAIPTLFVHIGGRMDMTDVQRATELVIDSMLEQPAIGMK